MSESQLMAYRLMIVPGGNFIDHRQQLDVEHNRQHSQCGTEWVELPGNLCRRISCRDIPPTTA